MFAIITCTINIAFYCYGPEIVLLELKVLRQRFISLSPDLVPMNYNMLCPTDQPGIL